jgi:peptide/nickel transport system substrate-binding protein
MSALRRAAVALLGAVAVTGALSAATAGATGAAATPVTGGTAVVGLETSPACLNVLAASCSTAISGWVTENTLLGAYRVTPGLFFKPVLVAGADIKHATAQHPFSVTYHIRPEAVWSDDVPVSADDFIFTYATIVNPANAISDRTGYTSITGAVKVDDKTVTFSFDRPFAAWKTLFSIVLPQHVLAGRDFNSAFLSEIADPVSHVPIASGPYLLTSWVPGQLTLARNPLWWGAHTPYLDSVVFRFPFDTPGEVAAVASGAVDVIVPSGSAGLLPLLTTPKVKVVQTPGLFQEHLEFHVSSSTQPLLGQAWFRQAVGYAIDRAAVAQAIWGAVSPGIQPLQSLVSFPQDASYVPDFAAYTYDPARVATIMTAHGCVRGTDGIWSCNGSRASIGITVNAATASRVLEESLMQSQALAAGIELVVQNLPPNVIFGPLGLPGGFYDSAIFAWVVGPDPSWTAGIYGCGADLNYTGYCSPVVTDLLNDSLAELNETTRAAELNAADALLAQDVPSLPLFQRPQFVAYRATLHNLVDNAALEGPFWNLADWWKAAP